MYELFLFFFINAHPSMRKEGELENILSFFLWNFMKWHQEQEQRSLMSSNFKDLKDINKLLDKWCLEAH